MDWSKKGLMFQYKKGLKSKVLDALVLVEDLKNMRELINKVVKINNRIYQREQANQRNVRQIPVKKALQQAARQWYGGLEPIDLSSTQESQCVSNSNRSWKPRSQGSNGQKLREQRLNQRFQQRKMFGQTLQQQQWFKDGACMNCRKQGHYARNCK